MLFLISAMRVEPSGTGYSNSIVAWMFHLLSRMSCSTSLIGRVPLAKRHVRAVVHLAIFDVDVGDPAVVLGDERHRRGVLPGDEVADVEVGAVVRRVAEHRLEVGRGRRRMPVIADHHLVLVGEPAEALGLGDVDFGGDGPGPERLGQLELVVHDLVGHGEDAVDFDDLDEDARVLELLAHGLDLVHGDREPPLAQLFGAGLLGRLLLRGACGACGRRGWRGRRAEKRFDRLRPQFHAADVELDAVADDVVDWEAAPAEVVGDVHPNHHATHLRVGPRLEGGEPRGPEEVRSGEGREGEGCELASGVEHGRVSFGVGVGW